MKQDGVLVYGAYGYTGQLIVSALMQVGITPILAGRDQSALAVLAKHTGLAIRCFSVEQVNVHLAGISVLINAAGPFSVTAAPLAAVALQQGCHYLDIGNETAGVEAVYALDEQAQAQGAVLLPGAGFGTTASNCLLHSLLPVAGEVSAATLLLAPTVKQRGGATRRTMLQGMRSGFGELDQGQWVSLNGMHAAQSRTLPFGKLTLIAAYLGDASAAYRSTGIGNIRACIGVHLPALLAGPLFELGHRALSSDSFYRRLDRKGTGHTLATLPDNDVVSWAWVGVRNKEGKEYQAWMRTGEGYAFTAATVALATLKLLSDPSIRRGALTPAMAFGAQWLASLPNTEVRHKPDES